MCPHAHTHTRIRTRAHTHTQRDPTAEIRRIPQTSIMSQLLKSHTCRHAHTRTHTYTLTHTHTHIHTHTHTHTHKHAYTHTHTHTYAHTRSAIQRLKYAETRQTSIMSKILKSHSPAGARPGFGSLFTQGLPEDHPGFNPALQQ